MHLRALFLLLCCSAIAQAFTIGSKKLSAKAQCHSVCTDSGGKAVFDFRDQVCKCLLGKYADAADVAILKKKAEMLGLSIDIIEHALHPNKRDISLESDMVTLGDTAEPQESTTTEAATTTTPPETHKPTLVESSEETNHSTEIKESEPVLRQEAPPKKDYSKGLPKKVPATKGPSSQDQIDEIKERIDRLNDEIETIQKMLSVYESPVPVVRARMTSVGSDRLRNLVEQAKERRQKLRMAPLAPKVGAGVKALGADLAKSQEEGAGKGVFRKAPSRFQIITEDPSLVDDDEE